MKKFFLFMLVASLIIGQSFAADEQDKKIEESVSALRAIGVSLGTMALCLYAFKDNKILGIGSGIVLGGAGVA